VLNVVCGEGDPADRGRTIGRGLGEEIERALGFYRDYLGLTRRELGRLVAPYREAAGALPEEAALVDAIAAGAGVDPLELWAANAFEELEPVVRPAAAARERCTTFTAVTSAATLLGHNEQWLAGDRDNVAIVVERPREGIALVSPTCACFLPAVGLNGAGVAQGVDSLTAPGDRVGIPRVLVSRHVLGARDTDDAVRRAGVPGRAGGYAHVVAQRGGRTLTVETTATGASACEGPAAHTNHYLDGTGDEPSDGSLARHERLVELLRERPPATPEDAMAILRDHASAPQAICEHGDPAEGDEASVVLFSMVCELEQGRMWVAAGNPCEAAYVEVDVVV
jgi:isopenicillin-N N-acyltransferase-like protein